MAHSIELLFDDRGEASIRRVWRVLADAGLPSAQRVSSPTNRPHVTLLAAERIGAEVDGPLAELRPRFPVPCVLGAPLVFGGGRWTLAQLVVPSAELLGVQAEVYRRCLPHLLAEPFGHSAPGYWTPHVTLGRRFTSAQVSDALAVVARVAGETATRAVGLRRWDGDRRVEQVLIS